MQESMRIIIKTDKGIHIPLRVEGTNPLGHRQGILADADWERIPFRNEADALRIQI